MKSKADIIRETVAGKCVLDIGGSGYGEDNLYERELNAAWASARQRLVVDRAPRADIRIDLNALPLPAFPLSVKPDLCIAFDVLEHLENPIQVLRWIPSPFLIVNLPNALSPLARWIERRHAIDHLFSFTTYTARMLVTCGGWRVDKWHFSLGKWSPCLRLFHLVGRIHPKIASTGITLYCSRLSP